MGTTATILFLTPAVLQTALFAILMSRRLYCDFPLFFTYTIFSVAAEIARISTFSNYNVYFWVYWATEAGYAVLGFLALYEVFRRIFKNCFAIWWFRLLFPVISVLLLAVALAHAYAHPVNEPDRIMAAILTAEVGVRLVQAGVFVLLIVLAAVLGLRWQQYAFGISAGFGVYACTTLMASALRSVFGTNFDQLWAMALVVAYTWAVLIWVWYFRVSRSPIQ
jgi:magnesium-transporting ATPase (P-type)